MRSSWWRLFLTSKGSLTFAVGGEANRKAGKEEEEEKIIITTWSLEEKEYIQLLKIKPAPHLSSKYYPREKITISKWWTDVTVYLIYID